MRHVGPVKHHRLIKYFTSTHSVPTGTLLGPRQIDDKEKCILMHPNIGTSAKCSKEMSQCCLERRAFGLPCNVSGDCIGFDEQITKVIVQVIQKGKKWWCQVQMKDIGCMMFQIDLSVAWQDSVGGPSCTWMVLVTWVKLRCWAGILLPQSPYNLSFPTYYFRRFWLLDRGVP